MIVRKSINEQIGILPPGPISNDDLFIKINSGKEYHVREGLEINKHYRGVNKSVWTFFHKMYGGGPIIVRETLDIYARDLSKELSHSKSVQRSKDISPTLQTGHSNQK